MSIWNSIWSGVKKVGSWIGIKSKKHKSNNIDVSNLISGVAGLGSSALNYASTSKGLKEQYKYNTALQQQAQNWATKMASTAHQLEVRDLNKAGLNPILSVTGGSGASAPGATGGSVGMPDYNLGDAITTALAYKESRSVRRQREFQNDLTNAQTGTELERQMTQEQQTELLAKQRDLVDQQIEDLKNQIKNRDLNTAGLLKRYATMNNTDLINAIANEVSSSASAYYNRRRSLGYTYDAHIGPVGVHYSGDSLGKISGDAISGTKKFVKNAVKGVKKIIK